MGKYRHSPIVSEIKSLSVKDAQFENGLRIGDIKFNRQESSCTSLWANQIRNLFQKYFGFDVKIGSHIKDVDCYFTHNDGTVAVVEAKCWSRDSHYLLHNSQGIKRKDGTFSAAQQVFIEAESYCEYVYRRSQTCPIISSYWITDGDYLGKVVGTSYEDARIDTFAYASIDPAKHAELLKELVGLNVSNEDATIEDHILNDTNEIVFNLNTYMNINNRTDAEGKLGQNFTPTQYAVNLVNTAMPWIKQMYADGEYEALAKKICNTKVFDPTCGDGALLIAAWKRMSLYLEQCNKRLGTSYVLKKSQFYGIEIDDRFASMCAHTFSEFKTAASPAFLIDKANILTANSLKVSWPEFTNGVENVVMIGNLPFETSKELKKSPEGRDTIEAWQAYSRHGKCGMRNTCDAAFFAKAQEEGYTDLTVIGHYKTKDAVTGIEPLGDIFLWNCIGGDAGVQVCVYRLGNGYTKPAKMKDMHFINIDKHFSSKASINGLVHKVYSPGLVECSASGDRRFYVKPEDATKVPAGSIFVNQARADYWDIDTDYAIAGGHIVLAASPIQKAAIRSHAMQLWVNEHSTSLVQNTLDRGVLTSTTVNSFPPVTFEDLARYDSMSDEDILADLEEKYAANL